MYVTVGAVRVQDVGRAGAEIGSGDNAAGVPVRMGDPGYEDRKRRQGQDRGREEDRLHRARALSGRHRGRDADLPGVPSAQTRAKTKV